MKKLAWRTGIGLLVAGALIASAVGPVTAQEKDGAPAAATETKPEDKPRKKRAARKQVTGVIISVNATTLVIKPRKKDAPEQTFTVPDTAKIMDGDKEVKLDTFKEGQRATVVTMDGTVTRVTLKPALAPRARKPKAKPAEDKPADPPAN